MLSVIIATHESERTLVRTLAALVPGAAAGTVREVIIADAGSTDATAEVADVAGCEVLVSRTPLAARLRAAAARARAPWLLLLRPGTVLDPTWVDDTARFMEDDGRDANRSRAAVFRPTPGPSASRPLLLEALLLLRAALGGRARPDQGLLIARRHYDRIGGHRDDVADPEADLLRRLGRRSVVMLRTGSVMSR
jgi:glycosyltransferase involved in cell wall biosynthesis